MFTLHFKVRPSVPVTEVYFETEQAAIDYGKSFDINFIVYSNGIAVGYCMDGEYMTLEQYYNQSAKRWFNR